MCDFPSLPCLRADSKIRYDLFQTDINPNAVLKGYTNKESEASS